ncbi:MAG: hypothetical protein NVSMB16_11290 [Acidimicrobiales bacterium]
MGGGAEEAPGDIPSPLDVPDPLDATPPDTGAGAPAEEPNGKAGLASASPGATTVVQAADPVASVADPGVVGPIDVGTALWVANEPAPPHPLNRTTPATAHHVASIRPDCGAIGPPRRYRFCDQNPLRTQTLRRDTWFRIKTGTPPSSP